MLKIKFYKYLLMIFLALIVFNISFAETSTPNKKAMPWEQLLLLNTDTFTLKSSSFSNGAAIPEKHSLQGGNLSPPLSWNNVPANTQSFVLIMDDPDAPGGTWDHWIVYNIPAGTTSLAENAGGQDGRAGGRGQRGRLSLPRRVGHDKGADNRN